MALAFAKPQATARFAKVLLIGDAGTGKTHAALTFPKPAVIDSEGSVGWFADRFDFVSVATKSHKEAIALLSQTRNGGVKCETLVIDSLTSFYNGYVNSASAEREDLRPIDWGRIKRKSSLFLDELYHNQPFHVVCTAWAKAEYAKPGDQVNGKSVGQNDLIKIGETLDGDKKAMYAFDFIFRMQVTNGQFEAVVLKSRSAKLKVGQRIPNFSWDTIKDILPTGAAPQKAGMTDEEQIAIDRQVEQQQRAPVDSALERARRVIDLTIKERRVPAAWVTQTILDITGNAISVQDDLSIEDLRELGKLILEHFPKTPPSEKQAEKPAQTAGSAPSAQTVEQQPATPPKPQETLERWASDSPADLEMIEFFSEHSLGEDEIQEACGRVTAGTQRVRYHWRDLNSSEREELKFDLTAPELD